jgi:hypothetical protein
MALDCLAARDAGGFLFKAEYGNQYHVSIVGHNVQLLKALGIFEKALLDAFGASRTNNHHSLSMLSWLLRMADPKRLRAAGDPLPGRGPYTIYRGVAGRGRARHVRGFSWSLGLGVAGSFARRFESIHADPAVFRAVVPSRCVLAYLNSDEKGRGEQEFLVQLPPSMRPVRVPESEWRAELERYNAERKAESDREAAEAAETARRRRAALTPAQKKADAAKGRRLKAHCKKLNEQLDAYGKEGHTIEECTAFAVRQAAEAQRKGRAERLRPMKIHEAPLGVCREGARPARRTAPPSCRPTRRCGRRSTAALTDTSMGQRRAQGDFIWLARAAKASPPRD